MYQALYRKWRPTTFDDVYGQEHITSILQSEVSGGKISHAYLFCGPRGTGKTTCAKIIAKAVNCEDPKNGNPCGVCAACRAIDAGLTTDVVEMDAASNNGVDSIRELRDGVVYTPADLKYRVYIIDEVHMLTISAFNALLKTLEEPPKYVIFILATTELHKIPATVLSRCQRFDFRRVALSALIDRMKKVCAGEGITAEDDALSLMARLAQGSFRDALNMLEFCAGSGKTITADGAAQLLGSSPSQTLLDMAKAIAEGDASRALEKVNEIYVSSRDITVFWRELISFLKDALIASVTRGKSTASQEIAAAAELFAPSRLVDVIEKMTAAESDMARTPSSAKLYADLAVIKTAVPSVRTDESAINERLSRLENEIRKLSIQNVNVIYHNVAEEHPAEAKKSEPKKQDPAPAPEKAPEATKKPSSDGGVTFTAMKRWVDIIRLISKSDASLSPILFRAKALEGSDGRLYLYFENQFSANLISGSGSSKSVIADAVADVLKKNYKAEDIIADIEKNATAAAREPIDELIESIKSEEGDTI
ncbi:MAG: DNA polymerase III subunit gamma/tau [Clostridia bacterium]|nr:DNA polymerase III subunit gamma/tau [Clostridia bacterium]